MKIHNNAIKIAFLSGLVAWTFSSCQDWLTITPTTQIVEEDFWEDKNDLEGVRYAAYQQMCSTVNNMALWGDLRSDSYSLNSSDEDNTTQTLFKEIRDGRIERDSANTYFDWGGFYQTINYCNKVLQHGAEVLERDKQFTAAEWNQMKAEITALRALNYFYLIRAFKDVPYTTQVVNNDTEVKFFAASNQLDILDSLITDLESVKGQARNRFSKTSDTKGLITNPAIYTMLSDMYLWRASLHEGRYDANHVDTVYVTNIPTRDSSYVVHSVKGDYQKAIDYADEALVALVRQNDRTGNGGGGSFGFARSETVSYGLDNCELYKNNFENFANGNFPSLTAFTQIFSGNSDEAIFELQFSQSEDRKNGALGNWGYQSKRHLAVSDGSLSRIYNSSSEDRFRDSRLWFSAWNQLVGSSQALPGFYCFKWSGGLFGFSMPDSRQCQDIKVINNDSPYCNWIIYRLSDVMLQKAEALAALGQGKEAMRYVNAIHRRWYCNDDRNSTAQPLEDVTTADGAEYRKTSSTNTLGNAPSASSYEIAVLNERQLEFIGEGKRWFDLVRYAERHAGGQDGTKDEREWTEENPVGNGLAGVTDMVNTLMSGEFNNEKRKAMINRFKNRYGLYNLIYYKEIQASHGMLEQNPVWNYNKYEK